MNSNLLFTPVIYFSLALQANGQWSQQTSSTSAALPSIHCVDKDNCFTVGGAGTGIVRKTVDGINWTISNPSTLTNLISVKMYDVNTIWAGKANGTFHYTTNAGSTWTQVAGNTTHTIYDIFFHDATNYIAVGGSSSNMLSGGNVTITTTNGGTSWTAQNVSGLPTMLGIHCFNSSTCVAASGAETIYKTIDGGQNWTVKHSGTSVILYDINFPSSTVGYAVGGDPSTSTSVALKTTDGGETWTPLSLVAPNVVYGTHFTHIDTGYVVGKGGFIMKTTDGGLNWGTQVSPVSTDLNKIFFPTSNIGYISGASGVILKTTNAGGIVTGVNEYNSESLFSILGNPSRNEMKIETKFEMQNAELLIFNSLGQQQEARKNISGNTISVNTADFADGIYFFRLNDENARVSGKFIVEK